MITEITYIADFTDLIALALAMATIAVFVIIGRDLYKQEKETMRLLEQLEAGYFDKEVGK